MYVVLPAVPVIGVTDGATVFTGAEVYVTDPLPVALLVLSVGEVCGAVAGVYVEGVPVWPVPEYTVTELARTVPETFPRVTVTLADDAEEFPVELYVPFAGPAFVIV